jgi:hypothetical protein
MENKVKNRLYEMFDKVCGTNFINEAYVDSEGNLKALLSQDELNEILKGYIECALWTEEERLRDEATDELEDSEDMDEIEKLINLKGKFEKKNFVSFVSDDIDVDSRINAYNDIKKFIEDAGDEAIEEAIEENGLFQLGMDIWFTRNGHGAGFFDHNYENEKILISAGSKLKQTDLYIGDDNKLYFS